MSVEDSRIESKPPSPAPPASADARSVGLRFLARPLFLLGSGLLLLFLVFSLIRELQTSRIQAWYLSELAGKLNYELQAGKSIAVRYPTTGPYDIRLGYTRLPKIISTLTSAPYNYRIAAQARISPSLASIIDLGIFPIYKEKSQAGLVILDKNDIPLYSGSYPERTYKSFEEIPTLVSDSLLYIENRELLHNVHPYHNPAVEWDRFGKAILELGARKIVGGERGPGGSTIATQLEKYRHSPDGLTSSPGDKLKQMASASVRAYLNGPLTLESRKALLLNYINSIPLAAIRGYGEVNGLGDGLWAWFDTSFEETNRILSKPNDGTPAMISEKARALVPVLSLFLAHRRPSAYLIGSREELKKLTDVYLDLLAREGVISEEFRDFAQTLALPFRKTPPVAAPVSFLERKAANLVRTALLSMFDMSRLYELDRFDLTVKSTIDLKAQDAMTAVMRKLREEKFVREAGLVGFRILEAERDPGKVNYSITLYERGENANYLRVETDNLDQPLNINKGVKLDLGSTAKLRTLVTYLEIVALLHQKLHSLTTEELRKIEYHPSDKISLWARDYLITRPDTSLLQMVEASMDRQYSANPGETFFTGGGQHHFDNFDKDDNGKVLNLWEGMRQSVNLVFIRLMRDIVHFYMFHDNQTVGRALEDMQSSSRREYLAKFADREGTQFLNGFYQKYRGKNREEILDTILSKVKVTPLRYAAVLRALRPDSPLAEFSTVMRSRFQALKLSDAELAKLYSRYDYAVGSLLDRGYIAKLHPLEIWLAGYLLDHTEAPRSEIIAKSTGVRQEVYNWLFNSKHTRSQNTRIRIILETEAFREIHRAWKRLGYPFDFLVPSYATSIGSSADKPAALAELMGILVNDGVRLPTVSIERLHFGKDTPYETIMTHRPDSGERVFPAEVAIVAKRALTDIVERGTARRVFQAFKRPDGSIIPIGGKTGTGDHRHETYGAGGKLIQSKVVNRTATFVFFIGDRYFGTVTAFVPGEEAAKYKFTSALPVQLLKYLAPKLSEFLTVPAQPAPATGKQGN